MDLFTYQSYKTLLRDALLERKKMFPGKFSFQAMAEFCRIQKTYLSRVLNRDSHLNADQLFRACRFLELGADERRFVALLAERERTELAERQTDISLEIETLRRRNEKTESHVDVRLSDARGTAEQQYYLQPLCLVTHMLLGVERFRSNVAEIARTLRISQSELETILSILRAAGIIDWTGTQWRVVRGHLHLSADSPCIVAHRKLLRTAALERAERISSEQSYAFSVVFSASPEVRTRIQREFLSFLGKIKQWVGEAENKEVYQMNFDLLDWSSRVE